MSVVVRNPLRDARAAIRHADGLVGHEGLEREVAVPERGQIDDRLHGRPRLPQRLPDAVEIAVRRRAAVIDLPAARLGQDAPIAVPQHDDRALDQPAGARVSPLVAFQAMLQRVVRDTLHAGVHRRVHLDASLQEVVEARSACTVLSSSRTCSTTADDWNGCDVGRATTIGSGRCSAARHRVSRNEAICRHERQSLISAAQDPPGVDRRGCVIARGLGDAGEQRGLVGIVRRERGQRPAEVVFRRCCKSVLTVPHVQQADVSGEDLFLRTAFRPEPLEHLLLNPQRESNLLPFPSEHVDASRANHGRQHARHESGVPELIAVFLRRLILKKTTPHELLGDRRSALRENRRAI